MDFLLVHGSTQSARGYDRLAAALHDRGHRTVSVDLPRDRPEWTADRYAEAAREQAQALTEPVLVVHSAETASARDLPPSTYVLPTGDRTLTPAWMRRAATERLRTDPVEVPGGHCPHVSRPEQVAALLDR
jgi:pimeloyl-ACP methyl ester carboxylesterase